MKEMIKHYNIICQY